MSPKRGTRSTREQSHRQTTPEYVPALHPTPEQFNDPIAYLSSPEVAVLGAKYGMVKIVPPAEFKPPLSINKNKFRFVPRLQKLKELNLLNRCRMFFHKQLVNYDKMHHLNAPAESFVKVGETQVYFYDFFIECVKYYKARGHQRPLHSLAASVMNGDVTLWIELSHKFKISIPHLQQFYRAELLPYFNFLSKKAEFTKTSENQTSLLQTSESDTSDSEEEEEESEDPCLICRKFDDPDNTLLCDSCNKPYHRYCLSPPLSKIPKDSWCCDDCVVGNGYYGFKDASVEYSLSDFQDLSDDFDKHFFQNGKPKDIDTLEKMFWSLVDNTDNDVKINYGADIHNLRRGEVSGFPTKEYMPSKLDISKEQYRYYAKHPMNLNNLPFDKNSLLNYLDMDISGMTIPWIYIGNTFSTFCWHVEDQYTLSANYQHYGATKKWYSIPSYHAERFEKFMEGLAPDLFAKQPDILHQLITLVSPFKLLENGIQCYTANQQPGEYIVTYPRVYHAGFNCGYNFNEAVNFTMTEWLDFGVVSSANYKKTGMKSSVFDIYDLMIDIIDDFTGDGEEKVSDGTDADQVKKLVSKCVSCLKSRLVDEYGVQHTILESLDVKPVRYYTLKEKIAKGVVYEPTEEEKKLSEDGIACAKCKGFCTFAFVKHYAPSGKTTNTAYLPSPQSSPSEDNSSPSKRHSKRIKIKQETDIYTTQILCLEDYLKLEAPNTTRDEFFYLKELEEVKGKINAAEQQLQSMLTPTQ